MKSTHTSEKAPEQLIVRHRSDIRSTPALQ